MQIYTIEVTAKSRIYVKAETADVARSLAGEEFHKRRKDISVEILEMKPANDLESEEQ